MATAVTSYAETRTSGSDRAPLLRRLVAGATPFDAAMGVACLAVADRFGDWLSVGSGTVRVTGVVFLAAAAAGVFTLRRQAEHVGPIVAANAVFALWCLVVIGVADPNALGVALLAAAAVTSGATAVVEQRLAAGR